MVLAKWLETITLEVARQNPQDEHAQLLGFFWGNQNQDQNLLICRILHGHVGSLFFGQLSKHHILEAAGGSLCEFGWNATRDVYKEQWPYFFITP